MASQDVLHLTEPNRRWYSNIYYENDALLTSRKTAERTRVALVRPLAILLDLKRALFS